LLRETGRGANYAASVVTTKQFKTFSLIVFLAKALWQGSFVVFDIVPPIIVANLFRTGVNREEKKID
jgi:hypothetical protein